MRTPKIKYPTPKQYAEAELDALRTYAPSTYPCKKCGWPVISGYCCTTCGDKNPYEHRLDKEDAQ